MSKIYFSWEENYQLIDYLALQLLPLVKEGKINQIISFFILFYLNLFLPF
jgi:hypothetical protein